MGSRIDLGVRSRPVDQHMVSPSRWAKVMYILTVYVVTRSLEPVPSLWSPEAYIQCLLCIITKKPTPIKMMDTRPLFSRSIVLPMMSEYSCDDGGKSPDWIAVDTLW